MKYVGIILIVYLILIGCDDTFKVSPTERTITIIELDQRVAKDTLDLTSGRKRIVKLRLHPYNIADVENIMLKFVLYDQADTLLNLSLYDDGNFTLHGDEIIYDGIFSNYWNDSVLTKLGDYPYQIVLREGTDNEIIFTGIIQVGVKGDFILKKIMIPDTVKESHVEFSFGLSGVVTPSDLSKVEFNFFETEEFTGEPEKTFTVNFSISDTLLRVEGDSTFAQGMKGTYFLQVKITDVFDDSYNFSFGDSVFVINTPPVLKEISIPDSLQIPENSATFDIVAKILDKRGPGDVSRVFYRVKKPDGTYAGNGTIFDLFDRGSAGDEPINDGIWSATFSIISSNNPGDYIFEFTAVDAVNQNSDTVFKTLTLY